MKNITKYMKEHKRSIIFYCIVFLFLCALCSLFPYTHDDWTWGSSIAVERFLNHYANYDGRWAGNILVSILTRNYVFKSIFVAATLTLIILFVNKIINSKSKTIKLLPLMFILATPHFILRQAVVWTSGFANYVFSTLLLLIYINYNKNIFKKESLNQNNKLIPLFFIHGFITSLFMEHITVYSIVLSLSILIFSFCKFKKVDFVNLAYFIGAIGGALLMFSNEAYHSVAVGTDTYRTLNPIFNAIQNYFGVIYKELIYNNMLLNSILSFILIFLLFKSMDKYKKANQVKYVLAFILFAFPLYTIAMKLLNVPIFLKYTKGVDGVLSACYLLTVFISFFFVIKDKKRLWMLIAFMGSIGCLTVPLFVVTPIGSRCFYTMYILFIMIVCSLLDYLFENTKITDKVIKAINFSIITTCILFYAIFVMIYIYPFKVYLQRNRYIEEHRNDETLILPNVPYKSYLWHANPCNDWFLSTFKLFYNISEEKEVKFVPLKQWYKLKK